MNRKQLWGLLGCLPALAGAEGIEPEDWNAKFQSTYVYQKKSALGASPYSAVNSLHATPEKSYTLTAATYLGLRLRPGLEAYLDVEMAQGIPFSGMVGMGSFSNGEMTRGASPHPKVYRQRLFVRKTWNEGGETEPVESAANQLAGHRSRNRTVLTAGNFSVLDIMGSNRYAHDPHTQFMNWANMTYGAFDYAADSRGFGWGVAAEWYRDDWVVRFARMTPPKEANGLPLDFAFFKHYGDQLEIEHTHDWRGQEGKARLLLMRNRAILAGYQDAMRLGAATNTLPDIRKVCVGEKVKYAVGVDVEQALTAHVGSFFRAMWADGRSETLAFGEVDNSLGMGLSVQGTPWGRSEDVWGLSLASNGLSKDRRDYLQTGAMSFFIGDGRLNYQRETIFETYYSWAFHPGFSFTLDYQHVRNPAYNADRGPFHVLSARLHFEQ